jgi:hypothetical protein
MIMSLAVVLAIGATPIKPALLTSENLLTRALGKPCAISREERTKHTLYWYMASRCDAGWCIAKCTARSGPDFPFWRAYAFEIDILGAVVDFAPPARAE